MRITHTLQVVVGGAVMAFGPVCFAQQTLDDLEHQAVHWFGGSGADTDVVWDVSSSPSLRASVGEFRGQYLYFDQSGTLVENSGQPTRTAGFAYLEDTLGQQTYGWGFLPQSGDASVRVLAVQIGRLPDDGPYNVYLGGEFAGSADLYLEPAVSAGARDGFVGCFSGDDQWLGVFTGTGDIRVSAIHTTAEAILQDGYGNLRKQPGSARTENARVRQSKHPCLVSSAPLQAISPTTSPAPDPRQSDPRMEAMTFLWH